MRLRRSGSVCLLCLCSFIVSSWAQEPEQPRGELTITQSLVQIRLRKAKANLELDSETKKKIEQLYQQALDELTLSKIWIDHADKSTNVIQSTTNEKKALDEQLQATNPPSITPELRKKTNEQLEELIREQVERLTLAKQKLSKLESEPEYRQTRRAEIGRIRPTLSKKLTDLQRQLSISPPAEENKDLTLARRTYVLAARESIRQKLLALEKEVAAYAATESLLPLRRDAAALQVAQIQDQVHNLRDLLTTRFVDQARDIIRNVRQDADTLPGLLKSLSDRNLDLAAKNMQRIEQTQEQTSELERTQSLLLLLKTQFATTKEKIKRMGLDETTGALLRNQKVALPALWRLRKQLNDHKEKIRKAQVQLYEWDDERSSLAVLEPEVDKTYNQLIRTSDAADEVNLKNGIRKILQRRKKIIDSLLHHQATYLSRLTTIKETEEELLKQTKTYRAYVDERILWVRSTIVLGIGCTPAALSALGWLLNPFQWGTLLGRLLWDVLVSPLLYLPFVAALVSYYWYDRRLEYRLVTIGKQASHGSCQTFLPTAEALGITFLLSAFWPLFLWMISWRLRLIAEGEVFIAAVAYGLAKAAEIWFSVALFRWICREKGLGESHFGWRQQTRTVLRSHLSWYMFASIPLVFVFTTIQAQPNDAHQSSLGRCLYVAFTVVVAMFSHVVLRPNSPILRSYALAHSDLIVYRFRYLWYGIGVVVPLLLAVLAIAGYYYTAYQLVFRLRTTIWYLVGLMVVGALCTRWFLINRRFIAFRQLEQKQAAAKKKPKPDEEPSGIPDAPDEDEIDVVTVSEQSRQLVKFALMILALGGIWFIWADVLPALGILDRVTLWSISEAERVVPITLRHGLLALLVVVAMILAARDIPGFLELVFLQRLPIDAGSRYAISALLRYALVITGVIVSLNMIGIRWSQYQWLVAAATVGLGFGLQEIFSNFVSGLIVLTERPIRIGDIVTVDDVSGVVTKISLRATTIHGWDRKEYIVPNKYFITGRVLNWTLSSKTNRVLIYVNTPQQSNPDVIRQLLKSIATEHPFVLREPAPLAGLEEFQDGKLRFMMLCYLPDFDKRIAVIHDLHTQILQRLAEIGIDIANPQHDIYVHTDGNSISLDGEKAALTRT
ncbi:MAG: mechanosensitive ion channel domain-containing protein [Gemmataceae bacterium]